MHSNRSCKMQAYGSVLVSATSYSTFPERSRNIGGNFEYSVEKWHFRRRSVAYSYSCKRNWCEWTPQRIVNDFGDVRRLLQKENASVDARSGAANAAASMRRCDIDRN